jgi:hypothetical protein
MIKGIFLPQPFFYYGTLYNLQDYTEYGLLYGTLFVPYNTSLPQHPVGEEAENDTLFFTFLCGTLFVPYISIQHPHALLAW